MLENFKNHPVCDGVSVLTVLGLTLCLLTACVSPSKSPVTTSRLTQLNSGYEAISSKGFAQTRDDLISAIESRGFKVFSVIDHQKGAASVDIDLEPTATIVFGNPKGGTPLLIADRAIAVDLPLKAAVLQQRGQVFVVMQDVSLFSRNYDLASESARLENLQQLMKGLLRSAVE